MQGKQLPALTFEWLTGASIYENLFDYPDYYACEWLIYGQVTGTTAAYKDCGSGTIPVFACEKAYPMMALSDLLALEIILFVKFPLGLFIAFVVYLGPLLGWTAVVLWIKKHRARSN